MERSAVYTERTTDLVDGFCECTDTLALVDVYPDKLQVKTKLKAKKNSPVQQRWCNIIDDNVTRLTICCTFQLPVQSLGNYQKLNEQMITSQSLLFPSPGSSYGHQNLSAT